MKIGPSLAHVGVALALQAAVAGLVLLALRADAVAALLTGGVLAFTIGAVFAIGFYVGRERRQSEEHHRSNRIPPWVWKPRALRDAGWPALAVLAVAAAVAVARIA